MKHSTYWKLAPGQEEKAKLVFAFCGKREWTDTHFIPLITIEQELLDEEGGGDTFKSVRYFQPRGDGIKFFEEANPKEATK